MAGSRDGRRLEEVARALGRLDTSSLTSTMNKSSLARALSPSETASRSSFSSVRENDDDLAQTFTRSKVSSYSHAEAVFDDSPATSPFIEKAQPTFQPPLTRPHSKLHGFWVPPDSFKGWREIPVKGKKASRSCEDLHKLHMTWTPQSTPVKKAPHTYLAGSSPLEQLPPEILGK